MIIDNFVVDTNTVGSVSMPDASPISADVRSQFERVVHVAPDEVNDGQPTDEDHLAGIRRWNGAKTSRLNKSSWCDVRHHTINEDLELYLDKLRARCNHMATTDPNVQGMVDTHTIDLVGETGPTLTVQSENETWNKQVVETWENWWESCTVDGMHGIDLLRRDNRMEWVAGNNVNQIVDFSGQLPSGTTVTDRLFSISPDRLRNPATFDEYVSNGVRRDRQYGNPLAYYLADPSKQFSRWDLHWFAEPEPINADDILHYYESLEPGQAVGVPRLATSLQDAADLREFDAETLDAARSIANNAVILWTNQPEHVGHTQAIKAGTTMELQRRSAKFAPPGYQVASQAPVHPSAHYIEYRHEKLRSIGRSCHMPLLMILLSAGDSNFSQSRIDINVLYERGLAMTRGCRERKFLTPCAKNIVVRSMKMATFETKGGPRFKFDRAPKRYTLHWNWEPMGQANPKDAILARERGMALGLTSLEMELAKDNLRLPDVIASRVRSDKALKKAGLPTITDVITALNKMGGNDNDGPKQDGAAPQQKQITQKPRDIKAKRYMPPTMVT